MHLTLDGPFGLEKHRAELLFLSHLPSAYTSVLLRWVTKPPFIVSGSFHLHYSMCHAALCAHYTFVLFYPASIRSYRKGTDLLSFPRGLGPPGAGSHMNHNVSKSCHLLGIWTNKAFARGFAFLGCAGSLMLRELFSVCREQGLLSSCGVQTSLWSGFSFCWAWALGCVGFSHCRTRAH